MKRPSRKLFAVFRFHAQGVTAKTASSHTPKTRTTTGTQKCTSVRIALSMGSLLDQNAQNYQVTVVIDSAGKGTFSAFPFDSRFTLALSFRLFNICAI